MEASIQDELLFQLLKLSKMVSDEVSKQDVLSHIANLIETISEMENSNEAITS